MPLRVIPKDPVKKTELQIISLRRGLEILRCFREGDSALSVIEIAKRTNLPKPTTSRLLATLARAGCLERRAEDGRHQLRPWALTIGRRVLEGLPLREIARPTLRRIAKTHCAGVALSAPHQLNMICLDSCVDPATSVPILSAGSVLPIAQTALGNAYLWALPPERRDAMLTRLRKAGDQKTALDPAVLELAFAELDEYGVCSSNSGRQRAIFTLAVPLVIANGAVLVVSCTVAQLGLKDRRLRDECGPDLLVAVAEINNMVGVVDSDWLGIGAS